MTTTTHRIAINENPRLQCSTHVRSTRVSKSRQYGACVVATATLRTIQMKASSLIEHEDAIERLRPLVAAAQVSIGGLSHDEASAAHEVLAQAWFKPLFANEAKLRSPRPSYGLSEAQKARAVEMTVAEGFTDPYKTPIYDFLQAVRELKAHEYRARFIREQNLKAGEQMVLSWHRDAAMAHKGLASQTFYMEQGYSLAVRTDIEITTK